MTTDMDKLHFRLVLLGSHGTGKTSILNRFLFKKFEHKHRPTVEDLFSKDFDLGSIEIKVDFLDTSGSMQFPAMRRLSITTGSAFMLVYALDDESSYEVLKMCVREIQEMRPDFQEVPIVFAGNKCDLPRECRKVSKEIVSNYVYYELPRLRAKVIECSSKDNINIEGLFRAYLSLAKVTIHSAVSAGITKSSKSTMVPKDTQTSKEDRCDTTNCLPAGRRSSSMKVALGVRKSCDAAIVSPIRVSACGGGQTTPRTASTANTTIQETNEVNLAAAIQSKLNISQSAKPRSRSLIWRSSRKTRTNTDHSECKVS